MKRHVLHLVGCIAVTIAIAGCAHSRNTSSLEKHPLTISIGRDGTLSVAGQKLNQEQLATQLAAQKPGAVIIRPHADVPFTQLRAVMGACKAAGVQHVDISTPK